MDEEFECTHGTCPVYADEVDHDIPERYGYSYDSAYCTISDGCVLLSIEAPTADRGIYFGWCKKYMVCIILYTSPYIYHAICGFKWNIWRYDGSIIDVFGTCHK